MDYHILNVSDKAHEARVAFHFPVPDETNLAGINLQTALSQYEAQTTQIPWDIGTEATDIENGAIYEIMENVEFNANLNDPQKQAIIENRWSQLNNIVPDKIRTRLKYWGISKNVGV